MAAAKTMTTPRAASSSKAHQATADTECLCSLAPEQWQRGCPTTDLPPAPVWTPGRGSSRRERDH